MRVCGGKYSVESAQDRADNLKFENLICSKIYSFSDQMFKVYKYSVILKNAYDMNHLISHCFLALTSKCLK